MSKLKEARKKAGLTQRQLAEKSGVSLSAIQKLEQGTNDLKKAQLMVAIKLTGALDCSLGDIVELEQQ